ncbi:hypothetical protein JRQ81_006874 [Phrynocephalus forsythii]|uniref:HTH La-type RNA-binding domain-containing protein n=1 Tax=Phrynocephalus forsythii TaxID=171643 RepID=A0A9Q0XEE0_9SAUR|nr:hypothetical protein JRQ81_006874 [Phrynocephalus forsythii]
MERMASGALSSPAVEIRVAAAPEAEGEGLREGGDPEEEEEEEEEEEGGEEEEGRRRRHRGRLRPAPLGSGSCSEDDSGRGGGAKSSGGENEDCSHQWRPPDPDLIAKLVAQIEDYFSDENLEKDAFLLKHVRRNKMGYVSVKLLTSFKKLNEDNRKVRRNTPVPVFPSENLPSKMLLVYDICLTSALHPLDGQQENGGLPEKVMEHLLKVFVKFGAISSVRVLKPGQDIPPDLKRFSSRYAQVGTEECAIVEFEEVEAAIRAHEAMCVAGQGQAMKVVLMAMKPPKKKVPKEKSREAESSGKARSVNKRVEELQYTGDESSANSSSEPESDPASPMSGRRSSASNKLSPSAYPNHHLSPNISPRSSPWSSPSSVRKISRMSPLAGDGRWNRALARRCRGDVRIIRRTVASPLPVAPGPRGGGSGKFRAKRKAQ